MKYPNRYSVAIGVPVIRVEFIGTKILIARAMELIRARPRDQHHCAAGEPAIFSRKTVGDDIELTDGLHRGHGIRDVVLVAGSDGNAIDDVFSIGAARSVDQEI